LTERGADEATRGNCDWLDKAGASIGAPAFWFDENANAALTAMVAGMHRCQPIFEFEKFFKKLRQRRPLEGDTLVMVYACDSGTSAGVLLVRQAGKQP
jgi:hypothetical protein